jgi:hypothetical protein
MEKVTQEKEALEASTAELSKQVTLLALEKEALEVSTADSGFDPTTLALASTPDQLSENTQNFLHNSATSYQMGLQNSLLGQNS